MSTMRTICCVAVVLACCAGAVLAADVQLVIKWPANLKPPEVQVQSDGTGKAVVVTDPAHNRVLLINVPREWSPTVTPSDVQQPSVRVSHGAGRNDQVVVRAFIGDELLTDATLVANGEVAEFPTANRIAIEVVRK